MRKHADSLIPSRSRCRWPSVRRRRKPRQPALKLVLLGEAQRSVEEFVQVARGERRDPTQCPLVQRPPPVSRDPLQLGDRMLANALLEAFQPTLRAALREALRAALAEALSPRLLK